MLILNWIVWNFYQKRINSALNDPKRVDNPNQPTNQPPSQPTNEFVCEMTGHYPVKFNLVSPSTQENPSVANEYAIEDTSILWSLLLLWYSLKVKRVQKSMAQN